MALRFGYDDGGALRLSHSGAFGLGAATTVTLLPGERLGIVALKADDVCTGGTFTYRTQGENAVGLSGVTFHVDSGKAASVTVEHLDANELGTFTR
ncbi:hypothetical protein [Streptomyces sp. NPDC014006]|uniref:hypothetical protein n=1 Tax=Streptomyces sp. NPDC014006 TaxID=3364870 RepID=UPI0036F7C3EF